MGLWQNTTYVRHESAGAVALALDEVLAREGMLRVPPPPPRKRLTFEPMQYDQALENDHWAFAVFPGVPGWTVIKSAPLEILSERAAGADRMRLADLCRCLAATAFQVNLYDSSSTVLVEVSAGGEVLMSGFNGEGDDPMVWHGIEVSEERVAPAFELHDLGHLLGDGSDAFAHAAARAIGGANARFCDNLVSVLTLVQNDPFEAPGGSALHYRWTGPSRQRREPAVGYPSRGNAR
jgi:hypothetical protein